MQQQGRILDGNLETLGLQATLKMLALSGKTGTLIVNSGQESLSLYLNKGQIAAQEDNFITRPDLLEVMRLLGRIANADAAKIRREVGPISPAMLEILVEYRVISEEEMLQWQEYGVIQALSRAVRWQQGRFEFHRNMLHDTQLALNVDHVLLESLRQADEWDEAAATGLSRTTVARWMPDFTGDIHRLGLEPDEVNVLCLANGQLSLQAIAYALLLSEARVAQVMDHLLAQGLIEVVDEALEAELERNLMDILGASQHELPKQRQTTTEQRLLALIKTLTTCINGLLEHHGAYARQLRERAALRPGQVARYLEGMFGPLLEQAKEWRPILDTVTFEHGRLDCKELLSLDTLVKGEQLRVFYWEAATALQWLMREICTSILREEVGSSRSERRFRELWETFLREIAEQMRQVQAEVRGSMLALERSSARGGASAPSDSNPRLSNPRMRQMETDPRMAQVRDKRRMS